MRAHIVGSKDYYLLYPSELGPASADIPWIIRLLWWCPYVVVTTKSETINTCHYSTSLQYSQFSVSSFHSSLLPIIFFAIVYTTTNIRTDWEIIFGLFSNETGRATDPFRKGPHFYKRIHTVQAPRGPVHQTLQYIRLEGQGGGGQWPVLKNGHFLPKFLQEALFSLISKPTVF